MPRRLSRLLRNSFKDILSRLNNFASTIMDLGAKRSAEDTETSSQEPRAKNVKLDPNVSWYSDMKHGKGRLIPRNVFEKFTPDDIKLLDEVNTSCSDLQLIQKAIKFRRQHHLCTRLPEDLSDSSYYIENGLRKVYPYPYLYQTYAKRRWLGRRLLDILKQEFRDIPTDLLKLRFDMHKILINGEPVGHTYTVKDNDFITHRCHRHELPVLATPVKKLHDDKDILVVDKPPSVPIHTCGRYRHNSVLGILQKEYDKDTLKVVHRLDRLVSGVLIVARNKVKAHYLEQLISKRDVQKEYVCRVVGNFPDGSEEDDGFISVDQPLESVPGKIGITVVFPTGKPSVTRFKKLNYNGKTSAVLCQPKTGRMHQIRVHLQYLGHPIVNDFLYNCDSFGPERGKGARLGKTLRQLSLDVLAKHRSNAWIVSDDNDLVENSDQPIEEPNGSGKISKLTDPEQAPEKSCSLGEEEETLAALGHYFTDKSWRDMERENQFDPKKMILDENCKDCRDKYMDPPLSRMFLYLHALRYSGTGWSYESEMPVWASKDWRY